MRVAAHMRTFEADATYVAGPDGHSLLPPIHRSSGRVLAAFKSLVLYTVYCCSRKGAAGDPSMRDMSTVICLRCMEPGHMARTCTNPASPNSSKWKRKLLFKCVTMASIYMLIISSLRVLS